MLSKFNFKVHIGWMSAQFGLWQFMRGTECERCGHGWFDHRWTYLFIFEQNYIPCLPFLDIGLFQDTMQLLITIMLLGDFTVTLLTLIQFYWMSIGAFLAALLILPLSLLSPFPAGLNALFSQVPRRSSLARVYALWNATSLSNIVSNCLKWLSVFHGHSFHDKH